MADLKVETTEPDPSATSIANDETVNAEKSTDLPAKAEDIQANAVADSAPLAEEVKAVMEDVQTEDRVGVTSDETAVKTEGHDPAEPNGNVSEVKDEVNTTEKGPGPKDRRRDKSRDAGKRYNERDRNFNKDRKHGGYRSGPKQNYSDNVKSDLTSQKESSDPVEIRRQVILPQRLLNMLDDPN